MTKRQRFVEMISYGPGKLPIDYVLACFDNVEQEFAPSSVINTVLPTTTHTPALDVPNAPPVPPVQPAPTVPGTVMGDTLRGVELKPAMVEEKDQDNADALAKLRANQPRGKK